MTTPVEPPVADATESYRPVFDLNPQPLWICDARISRFLAVNAAAVDHYGYSPREFQSMPVEAVFSPENALEFSDYRRGIYPQSDCNESRVWWHRTKRGQTFCAQLKIRSIPFDGCDATLVVVQNVTVPLRDEELFYTRRALVRLIDEDLPDVLTRALRCLCESLGADAAELWTLDETGKYLCNRDGWSKTGIDTSLVTAGALTALRIHGQRWNRVKALWCGSRQVPSLRG
jgi:PAS domain S-box-containing protein